MPALYADAAFSAMRGTGLGARTLPGARLYTVAQVLEDGGEQYTA
ncbi:MAG: hypothetical protein R2932_56760 [Caldilineaceae bacterium]